MNHEPTTDTLVPDLDVPLGNLRDRDGDPLASHVRAVLDQVVRPRANFGVTGPPGYDA